MIAVIPVLVTTGIAYGVLKVKTASTAARLDQLEAEALGLNRDMTTRVNHIATDLSSYKQDTTDRLARIETKLDILLHQQVLAKEAE